MCGRAFSPNFLFTWPQSKISVMGGEQAAGVLVQVKEAALKKQGKSVDQTASKQLRQEILGKYEHESHSNYASARLWDDGVIMPSQTRKVLGLALKTAMQNVEPMEETKHGVFRM